MQTGKISWESLTFEKLFKAYIDCRRHKRGTINALKFEYNLEENLVNLYEDLKSGNYKIGKSICFIVLYPKPREVWAASFRDRIVHHLVYNEIREKFYNRFIYDTYSCIPKRGTTNAGKRLKKFIRSITNNYTEDAYYLKADLKNFFVSINKDILYKELERYIDEKWVLLLIKQIIYHDPKTSVYIKSPKSKFRLLPPHKSLWNKENDQGLPIGNLTSQFFSNVYLNVLDQYVKHKLKCKYYCRYVDDFVILDKDPKVLNDIHKELTEFLDKRLALTLHQNKKVVQKIDKGIDFVGFVVKPNRTFLRQRILRRVFKIIRTQKNSPDWFYNDKLKMYVNSVNSYLGMLRNSNGYRLRKEICINSMNLFVKCDSKYKKLRLTVK